RAPCQRLVWRLGAHHYRGVPVRVSALQLLLSRLACGRTLAARGTSRSQISLAQHDHSAHQQRRAGVGRIGLSPSCRPSARAVGARRRVRAGGGLRDHSGLGVAQQAIPIQRQRLLLALLHDDRLPHRARDRRLDRIGRFVRLDCAPLLRPLSTYRRDDRLDLLAFRGRGVARRVHDLLRLSLRQSCRVRISMASTADMPTGQIGHPAPQRDIISLFILALAIFGVPLLWGGQLLLSYGLASFACYPSWNPLATPQYSGIRVALLAIGLAALVGGVGIAMLAVYSWRKTRGEQGGSQKHLVDIGE